MIITNRLADAIRTKHQNKTVIIMGLPLAPTINQSRAIFRGRMINTAEHRQFYSDMNIWRLRHQANIQEFHAFFQNKNLLICEIIHYVHRSRLWTKAGMPKKFDVDNRMKNQIDGLCKALDVDDKWIFKVTCEKRTIEDTAKESSLVVFSEYELESPNC